MHLGGILKESTSSRYVDAHEGSARALARAADAAGLSPERLQRVNALLRLMSLKPQGGERITPSAIVTKNKSIIDALAALHYEN